jgi:hypothetical protein
MSKRALIRLYAYKQNREFAAARQPLVAQTHTIGSRAACACQVVLVVIGSQGGESAAWFVLLTITRNI